MRRRNRRRGFGKRKRRSRRIKGYGSSRGGIRL